jgi:hypothetical protein
MKADVWAIATRARRRDRNLFMVEVIINIIYNNRASLMAFDFTSSSSPSA